MPHVLVFIHFVEVSLCTSRQSTSTRRLSQLALIDGSVEVWENPLQFDPERFMQTKNLGRKLPEIFFSLPEAASRIQLLTFLCRRGIKLV